MPKVDAQKGDVFPVSNLSGFQKRPISTKRQDEVWFLLKDEGVKVGVTIHDVGNIDQFDV